MNERILKLVAEARQYAWENETHWSANAEREALFEQKFAELIIRECMTQIQEVREIKAGHAGPEYTQGFDDGMFVAISTIEEHFGVEE